MMKNGKLFTKIGTAIVGIAMAIGVGVAASRDGISETNAGENDYTLIKDVSDLSENDSIIIGNGTSGSVKFLSTTQNTNNRGATDEATVSNDIVTKPNNAEVITLGRANNHWTLYANETPGYLYASSSSSNNMKTRAQNSDANSEWTISITNTGVASLTSQGSYTRNKLKFNSSSNLFSCYSSGQTDISIYKLSSQIGPKKTATTTVVTAAESKTSLNITAEPTDTVQLSAAVSYTGGPIDSTDKIAWESGNADIATVSNDGVVTPVAIGTARITATYAGDSTYAISSGYIDITVFNPNAVVFQAGVDKGTSSEQIEDSITKSDITIHCTSFHSTADDGYRFYQGSTLTISRSSGKISSIIFNGSDGSKAISNLSTSMGTFAVENNVGTWTGVESSVVFSASAQARASSIIIEYYSATEPDVTLDKTSLVLVSGGESSTVAVADIQNITNPTYSWSKTAGDDCVTLTNETTNTVTVAPNSAKFARCTLTLSVNGDGLANPIERNVEVYVARASTAQNPYDVVEAKNAIDLNESTYLTNAYVKGLISQIDEYKENYKSITYWISDDGLTTNQLEAYSGKDLNGADFNAIGDLSVGTAVVIKGNLKKFNTTYEFEQNNQIVSYETITLTITGQKTSFTHGEKFSLGEATITAHYNIAGNNVNVPTNSNKLSFTIEGDEVTTNTVLTVHDFDTGEVVVTYTDENNIAGSAAAYNISVSYAEVTNVTLNQTEAEIGVGAETALQLTATFNNDANPSTHVDWVSSNPGVATVSDSGLVTGVAVGNTTITATANGIDATCEITVTHNPTIALDVTSIAGKYSGDQGVVLTASVSNFDGEVTYTWSSNATSVATVTKDTTNQNKATVNFVGGGSAVITVYATNGVDTKSATCNVSVTQSTAVLDPIASSDGNKLYLGTAKTSVTLSTNAIITGNASNAVTWSSSNEDVATVESDGKVTAVAAGDATISATSSTGDVKTFDVKVLAPTGLKLISAPTKTSYAVGDTFDFMGLVVNATFNDETELELTAYNMSTPDMTKEGKQEITISSFGSTLKFEITISKVSYYKKLTNVSDLQSGDKLLLAAVKEDASKVATGISGTNKFLDVTDVTIANDKIEKTNAMEAYELILGGQEGAWTLGNSEGKVLGVTAAQSARLAWVDPTSETAHTWTIALQEDGTFEIAIVGIEGGALQYNSSSPRFTNYTTNQVKPLLFKLADSGDQPGPGPVAPTLSKIEIESMPTKTQYNVGDEFNQAGLSVKATYSDGSTKVISTGLTVTGFDSTTAGEKTLTVTYEGKTATFKVTVSDSTQPTTKTLAEINVRNTQDTYEYGQEIDKTKLTVTAVYSDGTSAAVTNYTLSGYNKNQSGQQTVTVSYSEGGVTKTATFTVTVGNQPTDPVETARQAALRELQAYVANLGESNYSAENWARIQAYLQEAPEILAGLDTVERIERYVTTFKNAMTAIPTIAEQEAAALADAKAVALADLKEYYDSFDQSQYDEAGVAALTAAYNDGKDAIEAATTTDAIDAAVRSAKAAMDAVAKKPSAPARRCGGDIAATSIILSAIALAGAGLLVFKKRKED